MKKKIFKFVSSVGISIMRETSKSVFYFLWYLHKQTGLLNNCCVDLSNQGLNQNFPACGWLCGKCQFVSVSVLMLGTCQRVFMVLTYLDIQIHKCLTLPTSLLLQKPQTYTKTASLLVKTKDKQSQSSSEYQTGQFGGNFCFSISNLNFLFNAHYFSTYLLSFLVRAEKSKWNSNFSHTMFHLPSNSFSIVLSAIGTWRTTFFFLQIWSKMSQLKSSLSENRAAIHLIFFTYSFSSNLLMNLIEVGTLFKIYLSKNSWKSIWFFVNCTTFVKLKVISFFR